MGRPTKGAAHVAKVQGDPQAKWRAEVILSTMPATRTVEEAYRELGIGPTHFDNLRTQALESAVRGLAPRPIGRPPKVLTVSVDEWQAQQRRVADLEREIVKLRAQLEVAEVCLVKSQRQGAPGRRLQVAARSRAAPLRRRPRATAP